MQPNSIGNGNTLNDGSVKSASATTNTGRVIGTLLSLLLAVLGILLLFTSGPAFFRYSGFAVLTVFGVGAGVASWLRISGGLWSVLGIILLSFPTFGMVAVAARYVFHANFEIDRVYYGRWAVFLAGACFCLAMGRLRKAKG